MGKELPNSWIFTDSGNLFEQLRGLTYKKDQAFSVSSEGMALVLRGGNIQGGRITESKDDVFVSKELIKESQFLKKGDVIIVSSTGSKKLIGKAAHSETEDPETTFGAFLTLLRPNENIESKYFDYFYQTDFYRDSIRELSGGININNIRKNHLSQIKFPLAPLPEQKRIVAKLDALFGHLDTLKTKLDHIPQLLKNFRQRVLTQAVTGKLTEDWRDRNGIKNWTKTSIGQLFEVKTGATPKRGTSAYYDNATVPWIKSGLVRNELIYKADEFITDKAVAETNAKVFPIGTLLVAMYGEGKTRGQVGWMKVEAATNQAIAALVNVDMPETTRTYVFYFCLSQYNEIRAQAEGGNQPNLNLSKIKNWGVYLPPEDEQEEIVKRVDSLITLVDRMEFQYKSLKAKIDNLPQGILNKAFNGELVDQDPDDEPASVLLERIKAEKGGKK